MQSLERLMHDVTCHVAESACTVGPPSTPVPWLIDFAVRIEAGRTSEEIPVERSRNVIHGLRLVESLWPDRTVGSTVNACHLTNLTIPDPIANSLCAVP